MNGTSRLIIGGNEFNVVGIFPMKHALITGITGQDGSYLAQFLLDKGYKVFGTYRRLSTPNFWRLQYLNIFDKVHLIPADLMDASSLVEAIKVAEPREIYNLAAQSFVGASFEQPIGTGHISGLSVASLLEVVRQSNLDIKFYQASTSELFGNGKNNGSFNEDNSLKPASPYAAAKLYGYWMTRIYRDGYGLFTSNGILFNHESPLRGMEFVTRKISNAVAKIHFGLDKEIRLGNLDSMRDWGYAPEYVECMWRILQQESPDDFVIATNESHSVRDFAELAFNLVDLDWKDYVKVENRFLRPLDVTYLNGDYSKANRILGWRPKIKFESLVSIMVREEISRWKRWLDGERFPWDAPSYPNENLLLSRYQRMDR